MVNSPSHEREGDLSADFGPAFNRRRLLTGLVLTAATAVANVVGATEKKAGIRPPKAGGKPRPVPQVAAAHTVGRDLDKNDPNRLLKKLSDGSFYLPSEITGEESGATAYEVGERRTDTIFFGQEFKLRVQDNQRCIFHYVIPIPISHVGEQDTHGVIFPHEIEGVVKKENTFSVNIITAEPDPHNPHQPPNRFAHLTYSFVPDGSGPVTINALWTAVITQPNQANIPLALQSRFEDLSSAAQQVQTSTKYTRDNHGFLGSKYSDSNNVLITSTGDCGHFANKLSKQISGSRVLCGVDTNPKLQDDGIRRHANVLTEDGVVVDGVLGTAVPQGTQFYLSSGTSFKAKKGGDPIGEALIDDWNSENTSQTDDANKVFLRQQGTALTGGLFSIQGNVAEKPVAVAKLNPSPEYQVKVQSHPPVAWKSAIQDAQKSVKRLFEKKKKGNENIQTAGRSKASD